MDRSSDSRDDLRQPEPEPVTSARRPRSGLVPLLAAALGTVLALVAGALALAFSGLPDVGATGAHLGPVEWYLETVRERAVERRAARLRVPEDLDDPERRRRGGELYRLHCASCHGDEDGRVSATGRGLNPPPPDLSGGLPRRHATEAFQVIAHGLRMTGMPAYGDQLGREELWDLVAWLTAGGRDGRRESQR